LISRRNTEANAAGLSASQGIRSSDAAILASGRFATPKAAPPRDAICDHQSKNRAGSSKVDGHALRRSALG